MYEFNDAWKMIKPVCGCHGDEQVEMTIQTGPHSLFYSCPKYYPQNRKDGERACANRINLIEYQKMVEKLTGEIAEAEVNGGSVNLKNMKWKEKGIEYHVIDHKKDMLTVSIVNKKALR